MGIQQVTLDPAGDDVDLDNTTWRRIWGTISDQTGIDGQRALAIDFTIEGDTVDEFQTRYRATVALFNSIRNKKWVVTLDDALSDPLATIEPGDGTFTATFSALSDNDAFGRSGTSIGMTLLLLAEPIELLPDTDDLLGGAAVDGVESLTITTTYNAGRDRSITVNAIFVTSGANSAQANLDAVKDRIFEQLLLVTADGSRDDASKQVLSSEILVDPEGQGRRLEAEWRSEREAFATANTSEARTFSVGIETTQPDEWVVSDAGPRPTLIHCSGSVFLSHDILARGLLQAKTNVETDVRAAIAQELGRTPQLKTISTSFSSDADQGVLTFDIVYQADNTQVISYTRTHSVDISPDRAIASDSEGFHHVQESPTSPDVLHTILVERMGVGQLGPEGLGFRPDNIVAGRQVDDSGSKYDYSAALETDFGSNVYKERFSQTFLELQLRA